MKYCFLIISLLFSIEVLAQKDIKLIRNVSVIPMTENVVWPNMDVHIKDGRIEKITPAQSSAPDNEDIDGTGLFLMPGLSEMHAHMPVPGDDGDETRVKEVMMLYLSKGVTIIRGMLGNPYHLELKKKTAAGEFLSPIVYSSSPSMNGNSIPDNVTARKKVKAAKSDGFDFLKIHPGIKAEVMKELVKVSNDIGIKFSGHIPAEVGVENAIKYGYASIDHADGYIQGLVADNYEYDINQVGFFGSALVDHIDWSKMEGLARRTAERGVWQVPTQTLFTRWFSPQSADEMMRADEMKYMPAKTRFTWRQNKINMISDENYSVENYNKFNALRKAIVFTLYQHGAQFLLGSDSPQVMNVPGYSIHHEIAALVECGIPVYDILKSGTANPATFFDHEGEYGTVEEGARANLILTSGNPLINYKSIKNPVGVITNGIYLNREYLADQLAKIAAHHASD